MKNSKIPKISKLPKLHPTRRVHLFPDPTPSWRLATQYSRPTDRGCVHCENRETKCDCVTPAAEFCKRRRGLTLTEAASVVCSIALQ